MQAFSLAEGTAARDRLSLWGLAHSTAALTPTPSQAQGEITWYKEKHRDLSGSRAISASGPILFGTQVLCYRGRIKSAQNDVQLPGNNRVPVGNSRGRTTVRGMVTHAGKFGDRHIEILRRQGIFALGTKKSGWLFEDDPANYHSRYTEYAAPSIGFAVDASGYTWDCGVSPPDMSSRSSIHPLVGACA